MKNSDFKSALFISLTYALFGGLWIFFSDRLLFFLIPDPSHLTQWQTYKGWAFVLFSTLFLFFLLRLEIGRRQRIEKERAALLTQDLTERKQAEEALRRTEEVFHLFIEYSPAAIAMLDRDMKYIAASRRYLEDYDLGDQNLVGRSHYEVFPEIPERWKEIHRRCLAGAVAKCAEDPFPRKDGRLDWVRWEIRPWYEHSKEIGGILLFSEVITAYKETKTKLNLQAKEMAALYSLVRQLSQSLSVNEVVAKAVVEVFQSVNPDLAFLFLREGERLLLKGLAPSEGKDMFVGVPEHRVGECLCGLAIGEGKALYSRDIFSDSRCTWEECKKAGLRSFAALPLRSGDEIIGVIGLAAEAERDFEQQAEFLETLTGQVAVGLRNAILHERVQQHAAQLEQRVQERTAELEKANSRLKEVDQLKSMFIASMSHELRTPLNSIIGFTGIILQGLSGTINEEQRKQLSIVKESSGHLLALINDIIDLSKIEAGKGEVDLKEWDLSVLVREVIDSLALSATQKGLNLSAELPEGLRVVSDQRRVRQVLVNLLGNAIKFTEQGTIHLSVRLVQGGKDFPSEHHRDLVEISVADPGPGIGEEDLVRLFKPFSQVNRNDQLIQIGTGLGLYLSRKIADLLGGEIGVESAAGKGSTFCFRLPIGKE